MMQSNTLGHQVRQVFGLAGLTGSLFRRTVRRNFPTLTLGERLAALPTNVRTLSGPLTIRWSDQQVPFVDAASLADAATGLGVVHGHLRLAQMELMRRTALGRLSEVAGKPAIELDALLRLVDFPRASTPSLAMMPAQTRAWVDGFAAGINSVVETGPTPPEFEIFGITPEPFTAHDLFAISRLCSADYAWKVWRTLNKLRQEDNWAEIWADLIGVSAVADEDIPFGAEGLEASLPNAFGKDGSNAFAIAGARTKTGKPLLGCDPHHLITTPSLWLVAGFRVPELWVWGLMIPALPIFGVGRNPHGAWGGTNLHATSSELVDVADEPLTTRETTINVGGERPVARSLRQSELGPVVSDAKPFEMPADTVALHWMGHRPSDEFTPFLSLMQARDWTSFGDAVDGYGLPGLNMVWADTSGDIGKMIACRVPRRPLSTPTDLVTSPKDAREQWRHLLSGRELPIVHNPPEGFVISANEEPQGSPVTISLFYAARHRYERIAALIGAREDLSLEDLQAIQADTYLSPAAALAGNLSQRAKRLVPGSQVAAAIAAWDGFYLPNSPGALAFELTAAALVWDLEARAVKRQVSPYWRPFTRLTRLVASAHDDDLDDALTAAIRSAETSFARHQTWGGLHRLRLAHPLAKLPWLTARLPSLDLPTGGTNETVMKSMHPFTKREHATGFAANARFLADLSDPDETFAVVLGGQDGWPGSTTMFDMVGPWRKGDPARLPASQAALEAHFPHVTTLATGDA
ncbi:MAG: penicillin acylase family protein [Pseudomonadota bacterium]